ncbi:hypothetical protein ACNKHM_27030 [Shigella sonnei]
MVHFTVRIRACMPYSATEHFSDWGYYEVNLIGGEQQIADLQQQDNLYTVAEMSVMRGRLASLASLKKPCTYK